MTSRARVRFVAALAVGFVAAVLVAAYIADWGALEWPQKLLGVAMAAIGLASLREAWREWKKAHA